MASRKEIEQYVLDYVEGILPGGVSKAFYAGWFKGLSDKEFSVWCERFKDGGYLTILVPPTHPKQLDYEHLIKFAKKQFNYNFWKHLILEDEELGFTQLTPLKYLVTDQMLARHEQLIVKKYSMPKRPFKIDSMSGQATGPGATLSNIETDILLSKGEDIVLDEFLNVRGGDPGMFRQMENDIALYGEATLANARAHAKGTTSTRTLSNKLKTAHIDNTI